MDFVNQGEKLKESKRVYKYLDHIRELRKMKVKVTLILVKMVWIKSNTDPSWNGVNQK